MSFVVDLYSVEIAMSVSNKFTGAFSYAQTHYYIHIQCIWNSLLGLHRKCPNEMVAMCKSLLFSRQQRMDNFKKYHILNFRQNATSSSSKCNVLRSRGWFCNLLVPCWINIMTICALTFHNVDLVHLEEQIISDCEKILARRVLLLLGKCSSTGSHFFAAYV